MIAPADRSEYMEEYRSYMLVKKSVRKKNNQRYGNTGPNQNTGRAGADSTWRNHNRNGNSEIRVAAQNRATVQSKQSQQQGSQLDILGEDIHEDILAENTKVALDKDGEATEDMILCLERNPTLNVAAEDIPKDERLEECIEDVGNIEGNPKEHIERQDPTNWTHTRQGTQSPLNSKSINFVSSSLPTHHLSKTRSQANFFSKEISLPRRHQDTERVQQPRHFPKWT